MRAAILYLVLICLLATAIRVVNGRNAFFEPMLKRYVVDENSNHVITKEETDGSVVKNPSKWFCCVLDDVQERCIRAMRSYPAGSYVPRGMKCWGDEDPPLSYVLFLPDFSFSKKMTHG